MRKKQLHLQLDMSLDAEVVFMRPIAFVAPFSRHKDYFTKLTMSETAIVFDKWKSVLQTEVAAELCQIYREAIVKLQYWPGQKADKPASLETSNAHLDWKKCLTPARKKAIRREALRWCYLMGLDPDFGFEKWPDCITCPNEI